MSNEYPKALYCGDKECNDMVVVDGLEQELEEREAGYVDFAELPDPVVETRISGSISEVSAKANIEEVDSLKTELLEALKAKKEIEKNFVGFRNDVEAMKARIAEIQGDFYSGTTSDNAEPVESLPTHYADMTSEQLREEIKKVGKSFNVRDSKAKLIEILEG